MHGRRHGQQHFDGIVRAGTDERGQEPYDAALEAGFVRIRPVIMTALAMMIGMVPMAIGLGEGGEQNAPLGRAVIGGLLFRYPRNAFFCALRFLHHSRPVGA